jgi:hypothetical protein
MARKEPDRVNLDDFLTDAEKRWRDTGEGLPAAEVELLRKSQGKHPPHERKTKERSTDEETKPQDDKETR